MLFSSQKKGLICPNYSELCVWVFLSPEKVHNINISIEEKNASLFGLLFEQELVENIGKIMKGLFFSVPLLENLSLNMALKTHVLKK